MITDDEFQRIVKYMKRKAGINLSAKRILIQGRLDNYLQKNGYESYSQFLDVVENCPMGIEAEYMLNALTTNHTYFWREHEQFLYLKEHVFPQMARWEADSRDQERDSFVANVTHELRTPVNGIKGNTELMMEQENDLKKLAFLKIILDSCNTMEGIINNILDFAKLEAGKFQLEEKPFSFREFMHRMEKQFQAMTMRKGLRLTMSIAQNIPDNLVGDELRLTQILNNLVSNAVKFTAQGYVGIEVTLNCQIQDEVELFFVVADTGIGISKEDKDKLFKSFTQVDASITRKYGGTGLGLSITKDLIGMMHGDIWAEGEKDKGTTFSFTVHLKLQDTEQTQEDEITQIQAKGITVHNRVPIEKNQVYEFKTAFNEKELRRNFEKLNLSADMENWYKAEDYAAMIKQLLQGSSKELQRAAFRMEMAVRKADYEKFRACADVVKDMLFREWNQEEENE